MFRDGLCQIRVKARLNQTRQQRRLVPPNRIPMVHLVAGKRRVDSRRTKLRRIPLCPEAGAALLEVVLALALFVAAASIVTSGMNASSENLERQRLATHALNLACSSIAEVQLGIRPMVESGVQPFEVPWEDWTWQLLVQPIETELGESGGLVRVEAVVRHKPTSVVRRLVQWIPAKKPETVGALGSIP